MRRLRPASSTEVPSPDMSRDFTVPIAFPDIVTHERTTFCQYLVDVPIRRFHRFEDPVHKSPVYALMEQVAHRIDEDHTWFLPPRWLRETRRPQAQVEPLLVGVALDSTPPLGEPLRVAVVAPRSDLRAAGHGVPSRVRPLDGRCLCHLGSPGSRSLRRNDAATESEHCRPVNDS